MRYQVGSGSHVFGVAENWLKLPDHLSFGYTHGIVTDDEDRVYIFHTGNPAVFIFDKDGNFLDAWGEQFQDDAHGFLLHNESGTQYLYATNNNKGKVTKLTLTGEVVLELAPPDLPEVYDADRPYKPTDVAVAPNGDIYVADGYGQHHIHQYNADGSYIRSWGGRGSAPGKMICPHGISVDLRHEEPELYVADRANNRIQVFTMDGQHKRFITGDMKRPCNFFYDGDEVYFPDLDSRITILDKDDNIITHLGDDPEASKQPGWPNLPKSYYRADKFSSPHAVCVDSEKSLYVAEWIQDGRITKLIRL